MEEVAGRERDPLGQHHVARGRSQPNLHARLRAVFVWDGKGELGVVDYQYGRDSASERFNKAFTKLFGINYYFSGIRHVGGNYLPNAYRTSFSSTHLFEQNPDSTKAEIDAVMENFFGVTNYPILSPKTIWHHDTWGKPCSPDTLIVVDFPKDNAYKHAAANDTVAFYETLESPWGRPYKILRLPMFEKEGREWWEPQAPSIFNTPGGGFGGFGGFSPPPTPPTPPTPPAEGAPAAGKDAAASTPADGAKPAAGEPAKPIAEAAVEPATEPATEPSAEPAAKPADAPAAEPAAEDSAKPTAKPAKPAETTPASETVPAEVAPPTETAADPAATPTDEAKPATTPAKPSPSITATDTAADEPKPAAQDGRTTPESDDPQAEAGDDEEEEEEEPGLVDPSWEGDLDWNRDRGPNYRPYMNSLVTNGRVYVPIDNCPDDAAALAVFQEAFPGYEIVGVDSGGTYSSDSLHCRTRNFMSRDPIRIYPMPPRDTEDTKEGYLVTAEVITPNGAKLLAGMPVVRWSENGEAPFEKLVMEATEGANQFRAVLPAKEHGTTISFYIEARDDGDRSAVYPPVAPKGLMSFEVRPDRRGPEVSRFEPTRVASAANWPPPVRMLAKDDMATPEVRVEYEINGEKQPDIPLTRTERTYWFDGQLAAKAKAGDLVSYRLVASDGSKAKNESSLPRYGKIYCPITETAEVGVVDMTERSGAGAFITQALGDLEVTSTAYRAWPTDWDAHDVWFVCLGVFADNHVMTPTESAGLIAAIERGKSIYLEGGDTWCHDPEGEKLNPLFGVKKLERGRGFEELAGEPRSIVGGLTLEYVGENLFTDRIDAIAPATLLFSSDRWNRGRAVLQETETARTIASTFSLAGLLDSDWPNNRKEILVRYLEFLGDRKVQLRTAGSARRGQSVPVRIAGKPGSRYILLASRSEYYSELPGYGVLRLDPANMYTLAEGRIGRSGVARHKLEIPDDASFTNVEIHCQALIGDQLEPGSATFTNRDILKLRE